MNQIQNELKHWGVLGMHWGKRKATGSKPSKGNGPITGPRAWTKEVGKFAVNSLTHPILSTTANESSKAAGTTKNAIKRSMIWQNTGELRDVNTRVKTLMATKKVDNKQVNRAAIRVGKSMVVGMLAGGLANVAISAATKKPGFGKIASGLATAVVTKEYYNKRTK